MKQPQIIYSIAQSLLSQHVHCRKVAAEILVFFCTWDTASPDRVGLSIVLRAFEQLESAHNAQVGVPNKVSKFERWLRQTEEFADGRGRMGSAVGAQGVVKGMDQQSAIEYCVSCVSRNEQ